MPVQEAAAGCAHSEQIALIDEILDAVSGFAFANAHPIAGRLLQYPVLTSLINPGGDPEAFEYAGLDGAISGYKYHKVCLYPECRTH